MTVSVFLTSQNHPYETRKRKRSHFFCVCVERSVNCSHSTVVVTVVSRGNTVCRRKRARGFRALYKNHLLGGVISGVFHFNPRGLVESTESSVRELILVRFNRTYTVPSNGVNVQRGILDKEMTA